MDEKILIILRKHIETVFGQKIIYSKDCTALSVDIYKVTNRLISETTLKRVWNLISSKFNPSKYTLNTLSEYIGFKDWNDYYSTNFKTNDNSIITMWETIRKKSIRTSTYSFDSIKNKMGAKYENALIRKFAENKYDDFLKSGKIATAFISPGGYGKSLLITKIVEKYYLSDNPLYPNDIIWFIDCGIIDLIDAGTFNIESFLLDLLSLSTYESFGDFFQKHPEDLKGKMILIIDGLNELSNNYDYIEKIINNIIKIIELNSYSNWFKVIITCRNNIWNGFERQMKNFPKLQDLWYDIDFNNENNLFSNVPLLSDTEINKFLQINNINITIDNLKINDLASVEIIRIPYFLYLFVILYEKEQKFSDIDLMREYVISKLSENYNTKINIIYKILENLELGLNKAKSFRNNIEHINEGNIQYYNELVLAGLLFEKVNETILSEKTISLYFTHELLFEYLIANYWIEKYGLSISLLSLISEYYNNSPTLKYNIINWVIKQAFKEKNIEIIKNIYEYIHKYIIKSTDYDLFKPFSNNLIFSVGNEVRKATELHKEILPLYASDKYAKKYFFEKFCDKDFIIFYFGDAIDEYINVNKTIKDQTFGLHVKFIKYYLLNNLNEMQQVFEKISSLDFSETDHFSFNYYIYCKILYQCLLSGKAEKQVIDYIKENETDFIKSNYLEINEINYNLIAAVDAFNIAGMHDNAIEFAAGIFRQYKISETAKKSRFYKYLQLFYANSLLQIGKEKEAFEIYKSIDIYSNELYTLNSKYYWMIRFLFLKIDFMIYEKNYSKALTIYEEIIVYAKLLSFNRFEKICKQKIKSIKEKIFND